MARTLPDGWEVLEAAGAAPSEIATLRRLAAELPDDYSVFHGVHWTRLDHGYSVFGEIDFIVLGPQGQVILIEQKSGPLEETPEGLVKRYKDKLKNVARQIHRSIDSLDLEPSSSLGVRPDRHCTQPGVGSRAARYAPSAFSRVLEAHRQPEGNGAGNPHCPIARGLRTALHGRATCG